MALALKPLEAAVRIQLGHGLKEMGRLSEAEAAYRQSAAERPDDADALVQLGHVLKLQDRRDEALAAYAAAIDRDPKCEAAASELVAAGARHLLPGTSYGTSVVSQALVDLSFNARASVEMLRRIDEASVFPVEAWDSFRKSYPTPAAPRIRSPGIGPVLIRIHAGDATATQLRVSLRSIMEQSRCDWIVVVQQSAHLSDHPVASLSDQDERIIFNPSDETLEGLDECSSYTAVFDAGLALDPEALAWLGYAFDLTGAEVGYADHDHHTHDWRSATRYYEPSLQWMPDDVFFQEAPELPRLVAVRGRKTVPVSGGIEGRRSLLSGRGQARQRTFHLPIVLSSWRLESAPRPPVDHARPKAQQTQDDTSIHVIVPTRDEVELLKACVGSLVSRASKPEALTIEVVDNRSQSNATRDFLATLESNPSFRISQFDEPFNWARINNQSAADAHAGTILLFANNDVEALTDGWDDHIRQVMADDTVGLMGCRLLYPDRTIQHAGVVMGANDGRPVHEGLGQDRRAPGPNGRWLTRRRASAVTGAFLAVRKETFDHLQGFDENLAVGYNDIDLCLRARERGLAVIYDPGVELIHHESKTRGRPDLSKIAWDNEELADLYKRWGTAVTEDPGLNPTWQPSHERPFDGVRRRGKQSIIEWLVRSAVADPWAIESDDRPERQSTQVANEPGREDEPWA